MWKAEKKFMSITEDPRCQGGSPHEKAPSITLRGSDPVLVRENDII